MKPHPELTIKDILEQMQMPEPDMRRIGQPETAEEKTEARAKFAEIVANPDNIKIACGACQTHVSITESTLCVCGQFICNSCREHEGDEECNHEPPVLPEGAMDDDL